VNGAPVATAGAFRALLAPLAVGDSATILVRRGGERTFVVHVAGYDRTRVRLEELPSPTDAQLRARDRWMHGDTTATH
jgi:hypothetical protein